MTKRIILFTLFLFLINSLFAADYYWVGGGGNWNDYNGHWALSSGGIPGNAGGVNIVPSPFDNVYFDANSGFTPTSNTVIINVPTIFCKNMDWTGATNAPNFISTQGENATWNVYGSITFIPSMNFFFDGTIHFLATNEYHLITSGNQHFDGKLWFDGLGSSWAMQDSISANIVELLEGDFFSNGHAIRVDTFVAATVSQTLDTLDLENSHIYLYDEGSRFIINARTSTTTPNSQILLNTNLHQTNFYYNYDLQLTESRCLYLNLIDSANIQSVHFYQPSQAAIPQLAYVIDSLLANSQVHIQSAHFHNKSVTAYSNLQHDTTELITIDSIFCYSNAVFGGSLYNDYVSDAESEYVLLEKGNAGVFTGRYETVHFKKSGEISNGFFDEVIMEGNATITADVPVNLPDFLGTYIGKAHLFQDGQVLKKTLNHPLQFDTLKLTEEHIYYFADTISFTQNGWLDAVGTCFKPIMFKGASYDNPFFFDAACDTIRCEYTILEGSRGVGVADFLAIEGQDKEGNNNWNFLTAQPRTLYWVGGDGNWDDAQHWSLSSGGIGGECLPTIYDDVFFDSNSGFTNGDSVRVNIPRAFCKSMDWTSVNNLPVFAIPTGNDLYIHGSLTFVPNMEIYTPGTVWFSATTGGNTITTSHHHFEYEVKLQGKGGDWSLLDSMSVYTFRLIEGDFYSNANSMRVGFFYAEQSPVTLDTLDLYHSNIYPYLNISEFIIYANDNGFQNRLTANLNATNFYFTNPNTSIRTLDLRLADTAYIGEVIYLGGAAGTYDFLKGNGEVYINLVEAYFPLKVQHSEYPTTTDLIHIDTTLVFSLGVSEVESCACNYTEIEGEGHVHSGLYNKVIIREEGKIFNGYFNYVLVGKEAEVYTHIPGIPPDGSRQDDFQGTFIGYADLQDDGFLQQEVLTYPLQFDTLKLNAGKLYEVRDTVNFTSNGWLDAVGLCDQYITIKSQNNNIPYFINAWCDTINVNYTILEYSTGIGNADFIADNTIDNGGLTNWIINPPQPRTLYWVGGNGNWSDPQHWSLTSGGVSGECMPTLEDDVFIDSNSGFVAGDSVIIDLELSYCKSMDWTGTLNHPIFMTYRNDATFFVNGSLTCINNMDFAYNNDMEFVSDTFGNTITAANQHFLCEITFDGNGSWTLLDSLTATIVNLDEGSLFSNNQSITLSEFTANPIGGSQTLDTLDFTNSNIYVYTGGGKVNIFGDTVLSSQNHLRTFFNNTNFYFTSMSNVGGRQLTLVLSDSAFINQVIFSGTNQATAVDVIGLNSKIGINLLELHRVAFVGFTNNIPSPTDLFRIDSVQSFSNSTTGFNLNLNYCDCNDVFVNRNARLASGRYDKVLVNGVSMIEDGDFGIVDLNGDATIKTGGVPPNSGNLFPQTTFGTLSLNENAYIFGETAGTKPLLVDTIRLVPGREYKWKDVMTITANGWLDAIGTGSLPIIMRSTQAGVQGTIKSLTDSICINYIFMSDLDTAGTAVFHAGKISTDIINNDGWVFEDCCSSFGLSELFATHDTTICVGDSVDLQVYYGQCVGCTFQWLDGDTSEIRTVSPINSTTYSVSAIRPEGCSSLDTFRVNIAPMPIINLQNDTTVSDTSQPLLLYHSPIGGTWSGNGVSSSGVFNPTTTGSGVFPLTYTVFNGFCEVTDSIIMTVTLDGCAFDTLHLTNFNGFDVSCHGANDGIAQISALQGISPFSYVWSNGNTDSIATNLSAGTYGITTTDANGCTSILSITINEPPILLASANIISAISFPGLSDGAATVNPSGGTAPYTYLWSNNATSQSITNLASGTYIVTITDDNGCVTTASVTLSDPTVFMSQIQINSNYNGFNVSCFGLNDGSATVQVANGTAPYSYLWSNGETSATATNLMAGWAVVTVTDVNNQTLVDSVNLTEPSILLASANILSPISCFGLSDGSLSANAIGGVASYTYTWSNNSTSSVIGNLSQGNYQVTVTDSNNCTDSTSITLTEPAPLTISIIQDSVYNGFGVRCFNANDGHVTAFANGGTAAYAYLWNNGQATASAANLSAGLHIITVTDANNCTVSDTILLNEPTEITATTTVLTDYNGFGVSCFGANDAAVNTVISGGVSTYNYNWNGGQSSAFTNNLPAGFAYVTVTDANNCILIDSVNISSPTPLNINTMVTSDYNGEDISCFGESDGSVSVVVSGGILGYAYQWNTLSIDSNLVNLSAGAYYVTATDGNGCSIVDSVILTDPLPLVNTLTTSSTSCDGSQNINAMTTGGTGSYSYLWNDGNVTNTNPNLFGGIYFVTISDVNGCSIIDSITITTLDTLSISLGNDTILCFGESLLLNATQANITNYLWQDSSTNSTFNILESGQYYVEIININGCVASDSIIVEYVEVQLQQSIPADTTICENTTFEIDATAIDAIQYSWQDGTATPTYIAYEEGTYTVIVTNIYNCSADFSTNVSIQLPPQIALELPTDTIMCIDNPIILNAQALYATDYLWEGESAYYQQNSYTDTTFLVTYPGFYSVEVSNYCGGFTQFIEVTEEDCGCYPYVPNAFTPNNDGNNDEFEVYSNCLLGNFHLEIYDRYGSRVFISNNQNDKWDGTIRGRNAQNGVYVWVLGFEGLNEKGEMTTHQMSGDVTIIR